MTYYCVFALRNMNGEVLDDIYGEQHDPLSGQTVPDDYWEKVKKLKDA